MHPAVLIQQRTREQHVIALPTDDKVEIRDASHCRGLGTLETAEVIRQELEEPDAAVASIGLAGENRVFFASIEQGRSSASRLGMGAIMGDKNLKAVACGGTASITLANPEAFKEVAKQQSTPLQ